MPPMPLPIKQMPVARPFFSTNQLEIIYDSGSSVSMLMVRLMTAEMT